ncbi:hypothetical protein BKA70DRAFT_1222388 [Coprinopsis sp. MPI-PUGE-AT-0042]|nr:hypothetical protein BKA70DRAFT_1222388 [Coprinopsis sp. MPI-PUGE-AT-0042]
MYARPTEFKCWIRKEVINRKEIARAGPVTASQVPMASKTSFVTKEKGRQAGCSCVNWMTGKQVDWEKTWEKMEDDGTARSLVLQFTPLHRGNLPLDRLLRVGRCVLSEIRVACPHKRFPERQISNLRFLAHIPARALSNVPDASQCPGPAVNHSFPEPQISNLNVPGRRNVGFTSLRTRFAEPQKLSFCFPIGRPSLRLHPDGIPTASVTTTLTRALGRLFWVRRYTFLTSAASSLIFAHQDLLIVVTPFPGTRKIEFEQLSTPGTLPLLPQALCNLEVSISVCSDDPVCRNSGNQVCASQHTW